MALTGRAALVAACGALLVGFIIPSWTGLVAVQIPLLLAIVYDLARAAPAPSARFTRSGERSVRLDCAVAVELTVENPSPRTMRALVRDAWPPTSLPSLQQPRHHLTLRPGERRRVTATLVPTRRGDHRAQGVTVRSYGPLGLAARQGNHEVPWTVRVLPAFHSRKHLPSKLARLRELDGRTSLLSRGEGTEFDSLREYVAGDDTRSIDWRASARQPNLVVRTWRPERDRHILLVLDTGRTSAVRVGELPRLDASMDAALLLTVLASQAGDRVDLLAYDRQVRASVRGRSGGSSLPAIVSAIAPLEAELVETDPRGLAAVALRAAQKRSLIVLFTGLETAPVEEGLLPVLSQLTAHHTVIVAAVSDPRIEAMAQQRGSVEATYQAAAATQALAERRRTTQELRSRRVTVVDATPDTLAGELTDAYLALKTAGRL